MYKWTNDVKIKVHGNPTSADIDTLEQVVSELNDLQSEITLNIVKRNANVEIYFAPESRFRSIEPYYVPVNMGFFSVAGSDTGAIDNARILIASTGITQNERSHLIREELTQSLGLMRDSNRYPESIFYQGWTSTTEYAPIDRAIISMLYDSRLSLGMNKSQVQRGIFKKCVNSQAVYPLSEQHGLEAQERR